MATLNDEHKRGVKQALASLVGNYCWSSVDAVDAVSEAVVHFGLQVGNFTDHMTGGPSYRELSRYACAVDTSESRANTRWEVNSVGRKVVRRARMLMA